MRVSYANGPKTVDNVGARPGEPNLTAQEAAPGDFSKIPLFPPERASSPRPLSVRSAQPNVMQSKLAVGRVDDPPEREADAVADRVMRMPDNPPSIGVTSPLINHKCASCEEEEAKVHAKRAHTPVGDVPSIVQDVLRSPGQPLDIRTRAFSKPRFGADFSAGKKNLSASSSSHLLWRLF
jgi:hypothetical protein